ITIDISKINSNTKAYIDIAYQNSANMIIASIESYIDQYAQPNQQ
ncbi:25289_t:CDS:1, partial [Gigaspora margarita]